MKKLIKSSALEDAFTVYPWSPDVSYIDGDSGLGLSYVVEAYGDEFVNLDESTLEDSRDILERYFDDEAYTRDFNINNPDEQIESVYDIDDPENLSVEELARYFDYNAYGRDIRLENNMIWDRTRKCWFSGTDTDEYDENNVVFLSNSAKRNKKTKSLTDYQKDIIKEIALIDFENGHFETDDFFIEDEDGDFTGVEQAAADYYQELIDMGPAGFYEEFADELDFDPDFVAEYGESDDDDEYFFEDDSLSSKEEDPNNWADWYKISQIENLMYSNKGMTPSEAKKQLGIDPSFEYVPTGNLNQSVKNKVKEKSNLLNDIVFLSNSRRLIKSGRYIVEDENGEVIASADTYEEAETVGGAKIIDTQNISQSKIGDLRDKYLMGNMTEDELFDALIDEVDNDKAKRLVEKWKPNVIKQNVSQSVDKAVGEAEDYFGTLANGNTVSCTNIITLADKEEVQKIAEKNDCDVKIGEFSVVFFDKEEAADNYKEMVEQSKKPITSANDYGWEIDSSEAFTALDSFEAAYGNETALNELSQAMGTDSLEENLDYIAQNFDFADEVEDKDVWEKFDFAKEVLGDELLENLAKAMGTDELAECMAFIFRQYDFNQEIESSRKPVKSSYSSWEDFYKKGKKLSIPEIERLDELHDKYGRFDNIPKEKLKEILLKIDDSDFDVYQFLEDLLEYFDLYDVINSSRKPIKSSGAFVDKDEDSSPECIIEIKEDGKWKAVGIDKNSPNGWSTEVKFKVFPSVEEAKRSGMAKRIKDAGYSEPDTLRFSSK